MRPVVFTDLDDTLFQTARKMASAPRAEHMAAESLNGSHSYSTDAQGQLVRWLLETTDFIPVTARTTEAFWRCRIPFRSLKICAHGAVILEANNSLDEGWFSRCRSLAESAAGAMAKMRARLGQEPEGAFRSWVAEEYGVGIYFCVKSNGLAEDLDRLDRDLTAIAGEALTRHRNGNNLSLIPRGIGKKEAVTYVLGKLPLALDRPLLGMGDSLTDLPFMELCNMMVVPQGSQIHRLRIKASAR